VCERPHEKNFFSSEEHKNRWRGAKRAGQSREHFVPKQTGNGNSHRAPRGFAIKSEAILSMNTLRRLVPGIVPGAGQQFYMLQTQ
jgi:hypothetical protein